MATRTRPVFNPLLGQFFEHLRQAARIHSQRTAAAMAARMGFPELHYNLIQRMEKGKLKSPTRDHLLAVSTVYGVIARLIQTNPTQAAVIGLLLEKLLDDEGDRP